MLLVLACLAGAGESAPDGNGVIRDWLLGGPYPSYWVDGRPEGFRTDFLTAMGGEAQAEPDAGVTDTAAFVADQSKLIAGIGSTNEWGFTETRTFPVVWRAIHADTPIVCLDREFLPLQDHIVAYAVCHVIAPAARPVTVLVGSDDDHKVWLNGGLIGSVNAAQGITPGEFRYPAELQRGINRLMVKVVDRTQGHGYTVALADPQGRPMTDVGIRIEHPRRAVMAATPGLLGVDAWDRGFHAAFRFPGEAVFAGAQPLRVQLGVPVAGQVDCELTVTAGAQVVLSDRRIAELAPGRLLDWTVVPALSPGACTVRLQVSGAAGGEAELSRRLEVVDIAQLKAETARMQAAVAGLDAAITAAQAEARSLAARTAELVGRQAAAYSQIEAAYAERRARLVSQPRPVDEAVPAAGPLARRRICLNGDQWLMGAGSSDPATADGHTPPATMVPASLPAVGTDRFFRTWHYPVANADPKDAYGKLAAIPGWADFRFNDILCARKVWFRTTLELGSDAAGQRHALVCDFVNGHLKVYLNGGLCGEYTGAVGVAEIALRGAKPGRNELDLFIEGCLPESIQSIPDTWGIPGDLHLETTSPVHVAEPAIRTSWRHGTLAAETVVGNAGAAPVSARLVQYCVRGGRVRYRLPSQEVRLEPGARMTLSGSGIWAEAEPWGIGGVHGAPVLYDLVSDLEVDGRLVDRQVTPFGFREFWVAGSDFYLNGRRIILQGDCGYDASLRSKKAIEVILPLVRADGINIIRNHDSELGRGTPDLMRFCDQAGMLTYAQMYPVLRAGKPPAVAGLSYEDWLKHPLHRFNLANYERWVKMLRNHPSVVIASTDNEIFTQAWDTPEKLAGNLRNDRLGAFYGRYVKSLEPSLVITRDGDEGTWGHLGKWQEDPPCDTANYHYPDFNIATWVVDWQSVFDFRPVVFGETLYHSYGAWDGNIGALPAQVRTKAKRVREVVGIYRRQGIPGQIFLGLIADGFIRFDDTGTGNPWGITAAMHEARLGAGTLVGIQPGYPWHRIAWPSLSGPGMRPQAVPAEVQRNGVHAINWFDSRLPSHVRNEVNDAYRDSLIPQPALAAPGDAECIVELGAGGAGRQVVATALDALGGAYAVVADAAGTAWIQVPRPGSYRIECDSRSLIADLAGRAAYAAQPGFDRIQRIRLGGENP